MMLLNLRLGFFGGSRRLHGLELVADRLERSKFVLVLAETIDAGTVASVDGLFRAHREILVKTGLLRTLHRLNIGGNVPGLIDGQYGLIVGRTVVKLRLPSLTPFGRPVVAPVFSVFLLMNPTWDAPHHRPVQLGILSFPLPDHGQPIEARHCGVPSAIDYRPWKDGSSGSRPRSSNPVTTPSTKVTPANVPLPRGS